MLTLERTIGSSSSSSVLLELIRGKHAPAGILLGEGDAILALGSLVARELGWHPVPMVLVRPEELAGLPDGAVARILSEGVVEVD